MYYSLVFITNQIFAINLIQSQPVEPRSWFLFLLMSFAGWLIYLLIDYGVIARSTPELSISNTIKIYWKKNYIEMIISIILLFVIAFLFQKNNLDSILESIGISVDFTKNIWIKALFIGFNMKLISTAIRKYLSPINLSQSDLNKLTNGVLPAPKKPLVTDKQTVNT
jgi:hypothetical protein